MVKRCIPRNQTAILLDTGCVQRDKRPTVSSDRSFFVATPSTPRKYKNPTPTRLGNIALYYLSRYAASEGSLRRVLENRIRRAKMRDEDFAADHDLHEELKEAIDHIVEKHIASGVIDDKAYAQMKVRSLRRGGGSARKISMKLQQKGIKPKLVDAALENILEDDPTQTEENAALVYAKKRRLGQFRSQLSLDRMKEEQKAKLKDKDYASMARAGFSYDIIRDTLGAREEDE